MCIFAANALIVQS